MIAIKDIGKYMKRDEKWFLQPFRHSKYMLDDNCRKIEPYSEEKTQELLNVAKKYCDNVTIRYV